MREFLAIRDAQKFKELIDPTRHRILELLIIKEMSVDELARLLEKDVSTTYRHIHKLETAGLVEVAKIEQRGPVTKKYYQRAAKVIVGIIQPEELSEMEIYQKQLHEKIKKGLLALKGFGFKIPEDGTSLNKLVEIAIEWYRLWSNSIDLRVVEEEMIGDISAHNMALKLLTLVETRKNPQLRRSTELLLSQLAKYREEI